LNEKEGLQVESQPSNLYPLSKFDQLLADIFVSCKDLSTYKGGEYAGDVDRLANFRRNADAMGMDMVQIWAVYYAKHHDSSMQYVKDIAKGKDRKRLEALEDRALDMMVYLSLFIAIIDETQGGEVAQRIHNQANIIKASNN